ncbi:hypothetical protein XENTR_v10002280 [Xenopus tropicalis]|uniref:Olfactory receptor n=1 Tax=Xenopus tropicalis TaxID=8364 RepID=A0A8J0QIW5_XENTR|nr:olfactory receptor 6M1 [Xenopus tropicalis]KAE8634370.1 hypothetical protein XENTR_v10002280 [Xenopus tropicalis]|eukprot:XP_002932140.1 PREDICTED: olfactory receptor 6M1-like [Xenopus tropicalis]
MKNQSLVSEFIFTGFPEVYETEILLFVMFLCVYVIIIIGNLIIITSVYWDTRLHTPMYFFLANISFLEVSIATVVIPKLLSILLSSKKSISLASCFTQCYLYFLLGTIDFIYLAAMSFDRYVAICNPLHYITIMSWSTCFYLTVGSWWVGLLLVTCPAVAKFILPYCEANKINHFFCDSIPLMKLACKDTTLLELIDFILYLFVIMCSLFITIITYFMIIIVILRIPSVNGRQKAFSTCVSHLLLVCLGYGGPIFIYIIPKKQYSLDLNKFVSVITVFVTPTLSPFILCLRNKSVQVTLMDMRAYLRHTKRGRIAPLG